MRNVIENLLPWLEWGVYTCPAYNEFYGSLYFHSLINPHLFQLANQPL